MDVFIAIKQNSQLLEASNYKMKILIFGLGHLAEFIVDVFKDDELWGTYRSELRSKFSKISSFHFDSKDELPIEFDQDFDYILWNFTPHDDYLSLLKRADEFFDQKIPWIFISSTGVFLPGEVNELSRRDDQSARGNRLKDLEEFVKKLKRKSSILRPAGLVDEVRNPARFFKSRKLIEKANHPVNLVHTKDVARFIKHLIEKDLVGEDFNLCCDNHPTKAELYAKLIQEKFGERVELKSSTEEPKIVLNEKARSTNFIFQNVCDLSFWA